MVVACATGGLTRITPGEARQKTACGQPFVNARAKRRRSDEAMCGNALAYDLLRGARRRVKAMMPKRWMVLTAAMLGFVAAPAPVFAATIDVAAVNLTLSGATCSPSTPEDCLATFTLLYLWLEGANPGPTPAPEISASIVTDLDNFTLGPVSEFVPDAFGPGAVPTTATATVQFDFNGSQSIAQSFLLNGLFVGDMPSGDGETLNFQFTTAVPEPSTLLPAMVGVFFVGLFLKLRALPHHG
jgi:hypothetical protein